MNNEKKEIFLAFILGFLTGIVLSSDMNKKRERRIVKFNKIKYNLDKGFAIDKENLNNDWQHIYYDIDKSFKKIQRDTHYETA
jgi:hypothetical protein